ncbi:AraC family transcriptional regulator [Mesorhizobium sp. ASY16-5R]|uniref:AraC family transcriptional regulator n=1 Tax=Mesorhizobium sp. ASY16-5R TaxID=3445772 RepID=UPI003FA0E1ED
MEPLAAIISLLRPRTVFAKIISGSGTWGVRYARLENVGFGLVLKGQCLLSASGLDPLHLASGDFVLMPPNPGFVMSSGSDAVPVAMESDTAGDAREIRHGVAHGDAEFQLLGGYFWFDPVNKPLLLSLLPSLVHIRNADQAASRLAQTMELLSDEALRERPGRDLIVERLVEVMLVEALRQQLSVVTDDSKSGLLRGLADAKLAKAFRQIHADVARVWTVEELARVAGLSRSTFSERFSQKVGMPPMEYVMKWRMARAKDILQRDDKTLDEVAAAIGYESASAFSTAFRREVGQPPSHFARNAGGRATDHYAA